jgi:hypothetical protein
MSVSNVAEPFFQQYFEWGPLTCEVHEDNEYDDYMELAYSPRYNPEQQLALDDYRLLKEMVH